MWNHGTHMNGLGWALMSLGWALTLALIVVAAAVLIHYFGTDRSKGRDSEEVLARRFADGDIDEQEYRRRLSVLRDRNGRR